jgi:arsenate reductase
MRATYLLVALLVLAFADQVNAQGAGANAVTPHRVVFVCEHGSVKSLVATVYFNRRAQERGLAYVALARGVAPDPVVPSTVRDGLRNDGFDVSAFHPRQFRASDAKQASLVVSFDQDVAKIIGAPVHYSRWDGLPGLLADFPRGRDEITRRVDALIDELAKQGGP